MAAPLCISYIRFSSASQREGTSLERQLAMSRQYAEKHGLHLDETLSYRDLAKSAYSAEHVKNGELGCLLQLIEQGKIPPGTVLLVESLDRLSRQAVFDAFEQFRMIIKRGIKIITLGDNMEYTEQSISEGFHQLLMSIFIMSRANEESERKSQRIRAAYDLKRQKLATEKQTRNCARWLELEPDRKSFRLVEDKVEVVKRIFSMSYEGIGIKTITRLLNEDGIPTFGKGNGWCQSSVRKILSNRAVIGEFQPHTYNSKTRGYDPVGSPIPNYFPKILDDAVYYGVQARIANGSHRAGRTGKIENLFGGITKCGYCGARMDVVSKGKFPNEVRYLVCDNARRGIGTCNHVGLKCNELEEAFMEFCREMGVIELLNAENEQEQAASQVLRQQVSGLEGELLRITDQIRLNDEELGETVDKLVRKHIQSRLTGYLHLKDRLEADFAAKKAELELISLSARDSEAKIDGILSMFQSAQTAMNEGERLRFRTRLRNELRQIVRKVDVFPRGRVYSDAQIERVILRYAKEDEGLDIAGLQAHAEMRDAEVADMKATQSNTKNDRFFTVYFKNGNYRTFKFSPELNKYFVSADRMGNRVEWAMKGKPMKPTIIEDTASIQENAIAHLRATHPDGSFTEADLESIRKWLRYEEETGA